MSFEINPVLAGKFDAPDYVPAHNFVAATNISASADPVALTGSTANSAASKPAAVTDVSGPDSRRYTQFDRTITDAGEATDFTFSDFLDLINPLEHIPIVSSIYRSITGEQIHPVSRVAGDILYGGLLGGASAVLGGLGAVADAGLEAETGKDSGGLVMAALFGDDDTSDKTVQLADAKLDTKTTVAAPSPVVAPPSTTQKIELAQKASATPLLAALSLPANGESLPAAASSPPLPAPEVATPPAAAPVIETPPVTPANAAPVTPGEAIETLKNAALNGSQPTGAIALAAAQPHPLNKQPYGGVMTPTAVTQAQDLAASLTRGTPGMRMGNMIYTNRIVAGSRPRTPMLSSGLKTSVSPGAAIAPAPVMPSVTASPVSAVEPAVLPAVSSNAQTMPAAGIISSAVLNNPSAPLLQNMMLKALNQYSGTASLQPRSGASVNILN